MKLGCCYNVYDGIELLERSIQSVRNVADYVCVVYQTTSNFGQTTNVDIESLLNSLLLSGQINQVHKYDPVARGGHNNEINKRNIGLAMARASGCTHFMTMDVDEMYDEQELIQAYTIVQDGDYDSSACKMITYYRSGEYAVDPPEEYFVPLIYKVDGRNFGLNVRWKDAADPTRRLDPGKIMIFDRAVIQMHHFSYVRHDIRSKLMNSSASGNFNARIEQIAKHYDNWEFGQKCLFAGREERLYDVRRVDNKFNVQDNGRC